MKHKIAITRVRKYFPQVNKVIDSKEGVAVTVTRKDNLAGRKKSPASCALAKACVRSKHVDGAIINIGFSYLIKGNVATRYKTSEAVGREIVSFDRGSKFEAGKNYLLSKISPCARLGRVKTLLGRKSGPRLTSAPRPTVHRTTNIRVSK